MKTQSFSILIIFSATFFVAGNVLADSLTVKVDTTISSAATFDFVRVTSTGRLTADGVITVTGNMVIDSDGVVTHSLRLTDGLRLNVTGTLDVQTAGRIDVSEHGLRGGGLNGSIFGRQGETYDDAGQIVGGSTGISGGSHGGWGGQYFGTSPSPYGLLEDPQFLGSGGAVSGAGGVGGGNGGGRITITAGTLLVNGAILANGQNGSIVSGEGFGGGSGGSIKLVVGNLGGTGPIEAIGGRGEGNYPGGGGGGGRIAIYYDDLSQYTGQIKANGNATTASGSAGTIYLKDNATTNGDLIIDNGNASSVLFTPLRTQLTAFRSVKIQNRGRLYPVKPDISSFTVQEPVLLTDFAELSLSTGVTLNIPNSVGFDVEIQSGASVTLDSGAVLNANSIRVNGGTLNTAINMTFPTGSDLQLVGNGAVNILKNATLSLGIFDATNIKLGTVNVKAGGHLDITTNNATVDSGVTLVKDGVFGISDSISSLTIKPGGSVTHSPRFEAGLVLNVTGTLNVQTGGKIDVSEHGLRGGGLNGSTFGRQGETYDDAGQIVGGSTGISGGSHGGWGGQYFGSSTSPYGLLEDPQFLGSGGAVSGAGGVGGGNGGGRITLIAGTLIANGSILANGQNGSIVSGEGFGGGSGGSIKLVVGNLGGMGPIEAIGGRGEGNYPGGGGGGGRIAIYYDDLTQYSGQTKANGNATTASGSAGTIYLKDNATTNGDLIIDNGNASSALLTSLNTNLNTFRNLIVRNQGALDIMKEIAIVKDLSVSTAGRIGRQ